MTTLKELIEDAKQEFREWYMPDGATRNEVERQISEIADSSVPIYTSDLIDLLYYDHQLGVDADRIGFDTVDKLIMYNVFEEIYSALYAYVNELDEEIAELEEDEE